MPHLKRDAITKHLLRKTVAGDKHLTHTCPVEECVVCNERTLASSYAMLEPDAFAGASCEDCTDTCGGCDPWDGVLYDQGNCIFQTNEETDIKYDGTNWPISGAGNPPTLSLDEETCEWVLRFSCSTELGGAPVLMWEGRLSAAGGADPVGIFAYVTGCVTTVATIELV